MNIIEKFFPNIPLDYLFVCDWSRIIENFLDILHIFSNMVKQ